MQHLAQAPQAGQQHLVCPLGDGLLEQQAACQCQNTDPGQRPEHPPPGNEFQQQCADHRRDGRGDQHHGLNDSQHRSALFPAIDILHDGGGHHPRGAAAQRLKNAAQDQPIHVRGQGAQCAGNHIDRQTGDQNRLTPEMIAQGSPDQRPERVEDHKSCQGQVDPVGSCIEVRAHAGQRWQIQVGGKRHKRAEQRDEDDQSVCPEDFLSGLVDGEFLDTLDFIPRRDRHGNLVRGAETAGRHAHKTGCDEFQDGDQDPQQKHILKAVHTPDHPADQRDGEREDVVDGHPGGERSLHVLVLFGDLLDIHRPGHIDRHQHLIQQVESAHHQEGGVRRKQELGEAIAQADHHQQHRLDLHHQLLAVAVDGAAEYGLEKHTDHPTDDHQCGDRLSRLQKDCNDHPGGEGDEDLFARAGEHIQDIKEAVLPVQLEKLFWFFRLIGFHLEHDQTRQHQPHRGQHERVLELKIQVAEPKEDNERSQDGGEVTDRVELSQPPPGLPLVGHLHADGLRERQKEMLPHAVNEQPYHHESEC